MLLVLVVVLVALTPLAYASPPDPSWNRGVYDDGDFDDGVVLITSATGVVDPFPLDGACSGHLAIAVAHQSDDAPVPSGTPSSIHARAPPAV